ncbi:Rne/Rng family ribonuclease [Sphingomonas sp.]|uniref:Rne/Rng family ribonuclease n=1 Tax=Sphingomonas sp. TaxID=28214 RepID=UPI003AFFAF47
MTQRMLIDARHPEETRVAVLSGNRIEEFDFESAERKQLKGNIYLAKVTRVEPSLQAAFIEFGGNRHGFLAFSEIHPDYYQIPKEDREALLAEEAEGALDVADEDDEEAADAARDAEDEGDDLDEAFGEEGGDYEEGEAEAGEGEPAAPTPKRAGGNGDADQVDALRRRRQSLRRRYKIQDVIHRRQVLLVQVVKEERGNKGAALTTYMSLAGRYCVLMPNTSHGGGISRKISSPADRKRLKSIMADLNLPRTMGCIVRTAGLSRGEGEIKRDFDYLARLWDEIRERTLGSSAPALIHEDSSLIKRAIRDVYTREVDEVLVEGEGGYHAARDFMKLLMPAHAKKVRPYSDVVPLFQRFGAEDQLSAMYNPVVQLKSGGYLVINPTEALVSIDINSGRNNREHNIEQTATATNLEAAHEIARQLRLRDMAGLVVIDFIDMDNNSNVRKVEKAMKEALKNDRARIQVGRISSFGLMEMSRQRLRTGVLEASTRVCPHCEGSGFVRTASSAGLSALRLLEEAAARGRGSLLCLRTSREAAIYVLNRKRHEIADIEDRYGVRIEVLPDGHDEGARMAIDVSGPPPAHAPKLPPPVEPETDDYDLIEDEEDDIVEADDGDAEGRDAEGRDEGDRSGRKRRRRRRRGGRQNEGGDEISGEAEAEGPAGDAPVDDDAAAERVVEAYADAAEPGTEAPEGEHEARDEGDRAGRRRRRGRRGGRRRDGASESGAEGAEGAEPLIVDAGDVGFAATDVEEAPVGASANADFAPVPQAAAPEEPSSDGEPAPRKARRRPRARTEAESEPAIVAGADEAIMPTPDASPDEASGDDAPRRRRSPRRKPETEAAEPAAETGDTAEAAAPRARRARRKPADELPLDPSPAFDPELSPEPVPGPSATETLPEPAFPEPVSATIPDAGAESEPEGEAATPRRGWWQRTFGG